MARNPQVLAAGVEKFLDLPGAVTEVVTISAGHSNQTYLLKGLDLILRTPPEGIGLLPPYDMRHQYDVLAEARSVLPQLPLPEVCAVCEDTTLIGAPFFLCRVLAGESFEYAAPDWLQNATPQFRHSLCEQWITAVATVHREAPLASLGPVQEPEQVFGEWRDRALADAAACETVAADGYALAEVFDAVGAHGYARSGPPALVHGDPKIANTMWQAGQLTGLVDWELAHNGEPLHDLGWILTWFPADPTSVDMTLASFDYFSLPGMFSREEVISTWEKVSGRSARGIEAYEVAGTAKAAGIVHHGAAAYAAGDIVDERMAAWGQIAGVLVQRAQTVLASLPVAR